jgi:hypothetical protein
MKTVISFDVGMKNLAYCLFQISGDINNINNINDYKILRWEVINLCSPIVKKCNNGGECECPENAKYCKILNKDLVNKYDKECDEEGEGGYEGECDEECEEECEEEFEEEEYKKNIVYFCNKHAKKSKFKIPPSELDIKKIKKKKLVDIHGIIEKYKITTKDKNGGCEEHTNNDKRQKNKKEKMIEIIQKELHDNYLENIENVKACDIDLLTLGRNMMMELDKFVDDSRDVKTGDVGDSGDLGDLIKMGGLGKYKIDIVIIENQISTIASRMKTLQGMIAQYFIMKGIPKIEFISAANKLKMFMTRKKTTYTERKIESVEVTKELLEKLPQFQKYRGCLEKNKKKDDLADCFLQGIYYLTLKKMINIEY